MKIKVVLLLMLAAPFWSACKKDRLEGADEKYVGTWRWVGYDGRGQRDPGYNRRLVILKKGKYKYSSEEKKLGHGIITWNGKYYQFLNRELFGDDDLDEQKISRYQGDTIHISRAPCYDCGSEIFVKEK